MHILRFSQICFVLDEWVVFPIHYPYKKIISVCCRGKPNPLKINYVLREDYDLRFLI